MVDPLGVAEETATAQAGKVASYNVKLPTAEATACLLAKDRGGGRSPLQGGQDSIREGLQSLLQARLQIPGQQPHGDLLHLHTLMSS